MLNRLGASPGFRTETATAQQVEVVVSGMSQPIRNLQNDAGNMALILQIQTVGESYGARKTMPDHVLREIKEFIQSKFSGLSIPEIREAFRMAASGELRVNSEIYGGDLNAKIFGNVLGAYRDFRRGVIADLIKREDNVLKMQHEAKQKEANRAAFDKLLPKLVEDAKAGGKVLGWADVPEFWYHGALRTGLAAVDAGLAAKIWEVAGEIVKREKVAVSKSDARRKVISRQIFLFLKLFGGRMPDFKKI